MKRKLSATAAKGTPSITKFFKKASEIDVKTLKESLIVPKILISQLTIDDKIKHHNTIRKTKENTGPSVEDKSEKQDNTELIERIPKPSGNQDELSNEQPENEKTDMTEKLITTEQSLNKESRRLPSPFKDNLQDTNSRTSSSKNLESLVEVKNGEAFFSLSSSAENVMPDGIDRGLNSEDVSISCNTNFGDNKKLATEVSDCQNPTVECGGQNLDSECKSNGEIHTSLPAQDLSSSVTMMEGDVLGPRCVGDDNDDSDDSDDSDDELLSPPAFLCDYRVKPQVQTPEKISTPLTGSPLTPISPFVSKESKEDVKCRYSLAKLVLEKPKQEKKDSEMARLQSAIHEQIEKGRMARLTGDTAGTDLDDDDGTVLPIHQEELDKFTSKDEAFGEEIPGEDIFPGFKEPVKDETGCCQPFPTLDETDMDIFTKSLFKRSDMEIRELLCGGWIVQRYLVGPCPRAVVQWLFHVLCYHVDNHTIQASYNALWSLMNAQSAEEGQTMFPWMPSIEDFLRVFYNYGANKYTLLSKGGDEMVTSNDVDEGSSSVLKSKAVNQPAFPLVNLTRVIQFVTLCVAKSPERYNTSELEDLVAALCCLSLDLRLEMCLHDIKTCLEAVYEALEQTHWPDEAKKLSSLICQLAIHHRHKLHLAQMQPYSCRGRDIRRLVAMHILALFTADGMSTAEVNDLMRTDVGENKDKEITNIVKSFETLEKLLYHVRISDDTDYYKLYTILELLDLAVGAETLLPAEKIVLDRITTSLRLLYGDIRDPRAMFMSRTKVKDLISRTISKFLFMTQGKKDVQKSICTFFEDAKSDLYIETLKETELSDDNVDLDTEKSFGSLSDQCSLSPASDVSDETTSTTTATDDLT